jgi:hypothetical protein
MSPGFSTTKKRELTRCSHSKSHNNSLERLARRTYRPLAIRLRMAENSLSEYNGNCVEVANLTDDMILVRDSKNPQKGFLSSLLRHGSRLSAPSTWASSTAGHLVTAKMGHTSKG